MRKIAYPDPEEHAPYVVEYYRLVPRDGVLEHMEQRLTETPRFLREIPAEPLATPHAPGEWTIKDVVQHVIDDERIYAYRTLRFARGDTTELPGFDQDHVADRANATDRSLDQLIDEYLTVRRATLSLFEGLPQESLTRVGVADGSPMSVRAAAFHIGGHEMHHVHSIEKNYLAGDSPP